MRFKSVHLWIHTLLSKKVVLLKRQGTWGVGSALFCEAQQTGPGNLMKRFPEVWEADVSALYVFVVLEIFFQSHLESFIFLYSHLCLLYRAVFLLLLSFKNITKYFIFICTSCKISFKKDVFKGIFFILVTTETFKLFWNVIFLPPQPLKCYLSLLIFRDFT